MEFFKRLRNLYNTVYKKITYRENFSFPILNFVFIHIMYIFYKRKNRANDKSNAIQSKKEEISAIFP